MRCGFRRVFFPIRTEAYDFEPNHTEPCENQKPKAALHLTAPTPHRTILKKSYPHRIVTILEREKPNRGAILRREKPCL